MREALTKQLLFIPFQEDKLLQQIQIFQEPTANLKITKIQIQLEQIAIERSASKF